MKIEIAERYHMAASGSSLLRLMQNNGTCRLDLFVREAIQNCLDAGDKEHASVQIDVNTGEFYTNEVSPFFEGIEQSLNSRFPGKQSYLFLRDTNTVGLTGPIRYSDSVDEKCKNLVKLVYEIGNPQTQNGAGGSWGLGKTVYFRMGIGLVIYYSQIQKGDKYESRLVASLIEDETKENQLIPIDASLHRGLAWWGVKDPLDPRGTAIIPVTNPIEIKQILKAFGIQPFKEKQIGTTIIIPFIDEQKLLEETKSFGIEDVDTAMDIPFWCKRRIPDYLKIAVQRWYAPRLNNKNYDGQYLEVYINGEKLTFEKMAPIFQLVQCLYNSTPKNPLEFNGKKIISKEIRLRSTFKLIGGSSSLAGYINYIRVTAADMKMEVPDNYFNPYYYINKLSSETMYNDPIIGYARKPGMVVSYETTGDWTDSIPKSDIGEYIVGFFITNGKAMLLNGDSNDSLEEYLRSSERADHMAWEDWVFNGRKYNIITSIKRNVRKKIKDNYSTIPKSVKSKRNLGLGKMLAEAFLPPTDFSYWDDGRGGTSGAGGTSGSGELSTSKRNQFVNNTSHLILEQTGPLQFSKEGINLPLRLRFGKKRKVTIEMQVHSEKGSISRKKWEQSVNLPFPVLLKSFTVEKVTKGSGKNSEIVLEENIHRKITQSFEENGVHILLDKAVSNDICNSVCINIDEMDNVILYGILTYTADNVHGLMIYREEM